MPMFDIGTAKPFLQVSFPDIENRHEYEIANVSMAEGFED